VKINDLLEELKDITQLVRQDVRTSKGKHIKLITSKKGNPKSDSCSPARDPKGEMGGNVSGAI